MLYWAHKETAMRKLTNGELDELEQINNQLLDLSKELTRRIARGTITPVGKRELVHPLRHMAERLERFDVR